MPLDAVFLHHLTAELQASLTGARVDKIHQPARDQIILSLRGPGGAGRLLLSANPGSARANLMGGSVENPASPPMFCMLLRKHLIGGRLLDITQPPMERVLTFSFSCTDELGEAVTRSLVLELMGRNSNLIFVGGDGRIVDCIRRVDYEMSQQRQVLPGLYYHLPPAQNKLDPLTVSLETLSGLLEAVDSPLRPEQFLQDRFVGLPPLICREIACRISGQPEDLNALPLAERYALAAELKQIFSGIGQFQGKPYLLKRNGESWDYSYMPIFQYGPQVESVPAESFSDLLDSFYSGRDTAARMRSRTQSIQKTVTNLRNRTRRKLENQRKELSATADRDTLRIQGELVTANLYRITRGQTRLVCENYYDPDLKELEIPLKPTLSPQQNAARYFKEYNKAKTAERILTEQIEKGEKELDYLESILEELDRAENERDIAEIRQELVSGGYLREQDRKKRTKTPVSRPMEFTSSGGLTIRVGRNNTQNDQLTLRSAFKSDLWFHAHNIHGSHVILSCGGQEPDETSIRQAASLAAWYSRARDSQNVPVDYTTVKNVKKPSGAKPGMVIYDRYHTVYVDPAPGVEPDRQGRQSN